MRSRWYRAFGSLLCGGAIVLLTPTPGLNGPIHGPRTPMLAGDCDEHIARIDSPALHSAFRDALSGEVSRSIPAVDLSAATIDPPKSSFTDRFRRAEANFTSIEHFPEFDRLGVQNWIISHYHHANDELPETAGPALLVSMELRSAWKPTPVATSREIFHGERRRTVVAITFIEPLEVAEARGTQVVEIPMSDGLVFGAYFLGTHPCAARTVASGLLSHGSFSKLERTVRVPEFSLQDSSRESPPPTGSFGIHVLHGHVIPLKRVRSAVAFQLDPSGVHANGLEVGDVPLGRTQTIDFDRPFGFYVRTSTREVLFEGRYY